MNHKSLSVSRLFTSLALLLLLAACSSQPSKQKSVDITAKPTQSAQAYNLKADSTTAPIQTDWRIMALKASVVAKDLKQGQLLLNNLARLKLSDMQKAEWLIAQAQLSLLKSPAVDATIDKQEFVKQRAANVLQKFIFNKNWQLADNQWTRYHQIRAKLFEQNEDYFNAAREWVAYSHYQTPETQQAISQQIWNDLNQYSQQDIVKLKTAAEESELQGWLFVASKMKTDLNAPFKLQETLRSWFAGNPTHPIALNTPEEVQKILDLERLHPQNIALLLPLTGKYEKPSNVIRDGFIQAMTNDSELDPSTKLTIIDTNAESMADIYNSLTLEQVDFVVGPLVKDNIEEFQQLNNDVIPMLALNFPDEISEQANTCYLTLSPEQEVEQAAKHLYEEGFKYPLVLAPQGALGERINEAFNQQWRQLSSTPAAVTYFGSRNELQTNIKQAFGLINSQQRINQIKQLSGMDLESEQRSRRDIDSVYIVATRSELTLLKPFIEVAINPDATPPKLFSNSRSNNGIAREYQDVSGIVFSDIPMLLNDDESFNKEFNSLWPNSTNGDKRLHALGMDSYSLIHYLPVMKLVHNYKVEGKTGQLTINDQCIVQRKLAWAEHEAFQQDSE